MYDPGTRLHPQLCPMFLIRVVDGKALAQLHCRRPNDMVFVRVIRRPPAKNVYSDGSFFDLLGCPFNVFSTTYFRNWTDRLLERKDGSCKIRFSCSRTAFAVD